MKKIISNFKYFVMGSLVLYSTSCSDEFLDLVPQQDIANEQMFQSVDDFRSAVFGIYDQFQNSDWYGRYFVLIPDVMGRDIKQNASANRAKDWAEFNGAATTTQNEQREIWKELYEGINMANQMINAEFTPPASLQAEYDQLVGEAYAARALAHFDLVRMYAQHYTFTSDGSHPGVPVVLEFDRNSQPSRNTVAEVYTQIISDFNEALNRMTIAPANAGTFSDAAVQALLSRVYLYMEDYTMAESMASAVINSGDYTLVSNAEYANQFLNGNSSEAILEVQFGLADNPGSDHLGGMFKETGYGDYLPSQDYFDLFPDMVSDVRSTMFLTDVNLDGGIYASGDGVGRRVNKYPSSGSDIATDNVPVVRLSEVILNRAEANAKSGNDAAAQADMDLIRQRANPAATPITLTGQALIDEILLERRRELFAEGHAAFDITRNQMDLVRNDCTAPSDVCLVAYPFDRWAMAIPQEEADANPFILQNAGYAQFANRQN